MAGLDSEYLHLLWAIRGLRRGCHAQILLTEEFLTYVSDGSMPPPLAR